MIVTLIFNPSDKTFRQTVMFVFGYYTQALKSNVFNLYSATEFLIPGVTHLETKKSILVLRY